MPERKYLRSALPAMVLVQERRTKLGPSNGVVGRAAGSAESFKYSKAMKNSGITWDQEAFLEFIASPKKKIPGTKMVFPGIKDEIDRENLFAYVEQFDAEGNTK